MDVNEDGWEGMNWIHLAQDMVQWLALINKVTFPKKVRNFLTSLATSS
jgi:hypothetical protein